VRDLEKIVHSMVNMGTTSVSVEEQTLLGRALSDSTRQRQAHLLGDATVRAELDLQDDTLAAATFNETTEADANGHEVSAGNGNSKPIIP